MPSALGGGSAAVAVSPGPNGDFVRSFGREGAGPGEFQHVIGMTLAPSGALWVVDGGNARYTVVDGNGYRMLPRNPGPYNPRWLGGITAAGVLYDGVVMSSDGRSRDALLQVGPDGAIADTFPVASPDLALPRAGTITFSLPFAPAALSRFDRRGYVWTASTHEYRLVQMTPEGDTVRIISRDVVASPLTSSQADSVRRAVRQLASSFGVAVAPAMIPQSAPLLKWFVIDDAGYLWVAPADPRASSKLDVFDDRGRFLGEVQLPLAHGTIPPVIRGDRINLVVEGDLGVPQVVEMHIRGR